MYTFEEENVEDLSVQKDGTDNLEKESETELQDVDSVSETELQEELYEAKDEVLKRNKNKAKRSKYL